MEKNGQLVKFLFNEEKEVISEETGNDVIRYICGFGIISSNSESARTYYHYVSDNQGSVRLILTDTVNDRRIRNYYCYDAFGESVISHEDVHNRFRFNGERYDPVTSQYYLRARFYNPVIGRFTQEDTYYGDGVNLYEYCRNNPVIYRDPSGHDAVNQGNLYGDRVKADLGSKLDYLFGKASGNKHNIERSKSMQAELRRIGIHDNSFGREYITNHLNDVLNDSSNISNVEIRSYTVKQLPGTPVIEYTSTTRESLLMGPGGAVKIESVWDGNRLITIIVKGGS